MKDVVRHPLVAATVFFCTLALPAGARADTLPPPAPTFVSVAPYACHRVDINWLTEYDVGSGLAYYNLYRRRFDGTILWEGRVTGDVSPYLTAKRRMIWYEDDTNFQVGLQAVDRAGNGSPIAWSATVVMPPLSMPVCQDVYRPSLPTGLSASIAGGTCAVVNLTWNNDASDAGFVTTGVRGYNVYRDDEWLYFKTPVPVSGPLLQEDRFGLVPGQTYTYSIKTIDNAGFESASATSGVPITIPADCRKRAPGGDRSIDVLGVRFPDQAAAPLFTMAEIENKLFANVSDPREASSARSFFLEASYGRATFHKQTVSGYYTLPHPTSYYGCTILPTGEGVNCNTNAIVQDALAVSGLVPTGNLLMVLSSGSTDSKYGANIIRLNPNRGTLDAFLQTAAHELSHSFGVEHSTNWDCPGYFGAGPDVTDLQFGCNGPAATGDAYSVLGVGNLRHHPAFAKRLMGFLTSAQTNSVTVDGTYTIGRLEDTMGSTVKELSLGTIEDYSSNFTKGPLYSVEYRTKTGYDGNKNYAGGTAPFDGVLVHLVPHRFHGADANTYLVAKLLPASGANIFYDPVTELGVKLNSTDGLNANVSVCGIHNSVCPPEYAASIPPWQ
jgi:hypothetical protein